MVSLLSRYGPVGTASFCYIAPEDDHPRYILASHSSAETSTPCIKQNGRRPGSQVRQGSRSRSSLQAPLPGPFLVVTAGVPSEPYRRRRMGFGCPGVFQVHFFLPDLESGPRRKSGNGLPTRIFGSDAINQRGKPWATSQGFTARENERYDGTYTSSSSFHCCSKSRTERSALLSPAFKTLFYFDFLASSSFQSSLGVHHDSQGVSGVSAVMPVNGSLVWLWFYQGLAFAYLLC